MACASYGVPPCGTGMCADPRCGPCVSHLRMMHGVPGCLTPVTWCDAIEPALEDHAETPSYRWRNEEMLPGLQVVEMSRRIEVHDRDEGRWRSLVHVSGTSARPGVRKSDYADSGPCGAWSSPPQGGAEGCGPPRGCTMRLRPCRHVAPWRRGGGRPVPHCEPLCSCWTRRMARAGRRRQTGLGQNP